MYRTVASSAMEDYPYRTTRLIRVQIMPSHNGDNSVCPKKENDSCPAGQFHAPCDPPDDNKYQCRPCTDSTFQPNENWKNDRCRLKRRCNKPHMKYADMGDTKRDASCMCDDGYHFPNEDQRACVPNVECQKGTAPGLYGDCEPCLSKGMFSDTIGRAKKCKPITNCEKQNRCTLVPSNGEQDNVCGPEVKNLSTCEELHPPSRSSTDILQYAIIGGIIFILLLVVTLLLFFICRRKSLRRHNNLRALTESEMEQLRQRVIKESEKEQVFCRKVLTTSFSFIEERIDRQIWTLAQELFRTHPKPGHFEHIVEKYKDSQAKYTVNGYLQDWKQWKGDNKDTVAELFRGLRQVKRDDIANEICMCLRSDVNYNVDGDFQTGYQRQSLKDDCVYIFFPCFYQANEKSPPVPMGGVVVVENDNGEAGTKLLAIATDDLEDGADDGAGDKPPGTFYSPQLSPSAPTLEDSTVYPEVKFSRQWSQPVQATS
ncbi:uncharacterized protein LOC106058383 isoform X2 [Biomphalaria glabrata]|uniref:Uncharacterized protein LOC106058383 isoform X2 n=1 Tax=Biomphalaria glabrata TaxID=6526 RepID=A0A9W2YPR6_BIOGL|nr:uncharacterized protein LOC106058383 isoform X2 [Biomphalaria glabrata]